MTEALSESVVKMARIAKEPVASHVQELEEKIADLKRQLEAVDRAVETKEELAASWRLTAEEWEEKYKVAVEGEAGKWQHAVATWQARYEDALRRISKLESESRGAGCVCGD